MHFSPNRAFVFLLALASSALADAPLPEVQPVDLAKWHPADFSDEDLDLPYYFFHLHTLANAVESDGPDRGFLHINVWRRSDTPPNSRIMENILSLAWFYCADR